MLNSFQKLIEGSAEMKTFQITCPDCGKQEFGSLEQVFMTYPVKGIYENGEMVYDRDNPVVGNGQVLAFQCQNCGYEIQDKDGNSITDSIQLFAWVRHLSSRK
jgi:rubredoxin